MNKIILSKITTIKEPAAIFAAANVSEAIGMKNHQVASFLVESGRGARTAAVYTMTLAASTFSAGDTITINGTVYTCVASAADAEANEFNAGTAAQTATALQPLVNSSEDDFTVTKSSATIIFTQTVAGTGVIPVIASSVTDGVSIAITTAYADGSKDLTITVEAQKDDEAGTAIYFLIDQIGVVAEPTLQNTKTVKVGEGQAYGVTVTSDMLAGTGFEKIILKTTEISGSAIPGSIICLQSQPRYC